MCVLIGCGDSKPAPKPEPPPPPPPPALVSATDQYKLPAAKTRGALPTKPAAYIFVSREGKLRIGADPTLSAAVDATEAESLRKLIPPPGQTFTAVPPPSAAEHGGTPDHGAAGKPGEQIGTGFAGRTGGFYDVTSAAIAFAGEAPTGDARFVLVADRDAPFRDMVAVLQAIGESTAIAIDDGAGGGTALSVAIDTRNQPTWGGGIEVNEDQPWSDLVAALDTAAAAAPGKPIGITMLYTRSGFGVGSDGGGMRGISLNEAQIRIGQPSVIGNLDKAIVRRYVKRNVSKLRYCYEKQRLADEKLAGTVTATFAITPQGSVSEATADGVSSEVSTCVASVLKIIKYPSGPGVAKVTIPFDFHPPRGTAP